MNLPKFALKGDAFVILACLACIAIIFTWMWKAPHEDVLFTHASEKPSITNGVLRDAGQVLTEAEKARLLDEIRQAQTRQEAQYIKDGGDPKATHFYTLWVGGSADTKDYLPIIHFMGTKGWKLSSYPPVGGRYMVFQKKQPPTPVK